MSPTETMMNKGTRTFEAFWKMGKAGIRLTREAMD